MRARHHVVSEDPIERCFAEIAALRDEPALSPAEVALRVEQLAACARGERCPEVEFDPVARALREAAGRLPRRRRAAWERRVREALARARPVATAGAARW